MFYIGDVYKFAEYHLSEYDHILGIINNRPNTLYYDKFIDDDCELIIWLNTNNTDKYLTMYKKVI